MGKSVKGTKTEQNLLKSFAGESQARTRYTFFASKAKKEGFEQIAGVFAETARPGEGTCRTVSPNSSRAAMLEITASYPAGKIGTTMENLIEAAAGENEEWSELYPTFAKVAEEEGFPVICRRVPQHRYRRGTARNPLPQAAGPCRGRQRILA